MDENTLKDIQYLLCMYEAYIEDTTSLSSAWANKKFKAMCNKYGFNNAGDLHKGFDDLFC